ncbi:FAD-dependent oxidoreductase [Companilactobacillus metriopterae]|uniref:FAD-dependent oxidoreductase n=1 Tax=Companilactobacillus metriopterae TaxID=1909267 RepID=UPI00100B2CAB|nr:FAD-dependent oxidoreductase [Companilactobacillus metriopterae]
MIYVIIGGVAGGMSAATRLSRLNENSEIIVLEKGPNVSFANCGLPFYIGGEITNHDDLIVQTPEKLKNRYNLDVRVNSEVIAVNPELHQVTIMNDNQKYSLTYDKLIVSPGAKPFVPEIEGIESADNIFTLRNVPDVDKIYNFIENNNIKTATITGAGFIGLEVAESLVKRGIKVHIIEKGTQILPPLDEEMALFVEDELIKNNIEIIKQNSIKTFKDNGKLIVLEDNSKIESDLNIISIGVIPNTEFLNNSKIELGIRNSIKVNDQYQTNISDIFAIGDAIEVNQYTSGEESLISLAGPANRQGRMVADIISGKNRINQGTIGTSIVRTFNLESASTGLNEKQLKKQHIEYKSLHVRGTNHASYYPDSKNILLKIIFNPNNGLIYGAQAIGENGVDKRIDIISSAIYSKLSIEDLINFELTYAPPFSSAKDIVNMAGYIGQNILEGNTVPVYWHELRDLLANGELLVDVRSKSEFELGHIEGAINIPLDVLRDNLDKLNKSNKYIVSCLTGQRSYTAEQILRQHGFDVKNLDGAYNLYSEIKKEEIVK